MKCIELDVRLLDQPVLQPVVAPGGVDPDQVVVDPPVLQGADDAPGVGLLWHATAAVGAPARGDVVDEVVVLDGVGPDVPDRELGPPLHLDALELPDLEQLLLPLGDVLEEVEGGVLQLGEEHVLQKRRR